jgi:hypothetical protein
LTNTGIPFLLQNLLDKVGNGTVIIDDQDRALRGSHGCPHRLLSLGGDLPLVRFGSNHAEIAEVADCSRRLTGETSLLRHHIERCRRDLTQAAGSEWEIPRSLLHGHHLAANLVRAVGPYTRSVPEERLQPWRGPLSLRRRSWLPRPGSLPRARERRPFFIDTAKMCTQGGDEVWRGLAATAQG